MPMGIVTVFLTRQDGLQAQCILNVCTIHSASLTFIKCNTELFSFVYILCFCHKIFQQQSLFQIAMLIIDESLFLKKKKEKKN